MMNQSHQWSAETFSLCFESINDSCVKTVYSPVFRAPLYLLFIIAIILIVFGNLWVICTISFFQQLHTPTNYLILSMAVSDLLLGSFVMPPSMLRSLETCWYFGDFFCKFHSATDFTLCNASVLHLVFISIDRYYAVCQPFHYQSRMTTRVSVFMILISWSFSAFFGFGIIFSELKIEKKRTEELHVACKGGCLALHGREIGVTYSLVFYFLPMFIIVSLYSRVFIIALKHVRVINSAASSLSATKMDLKATKTLAIIIGVFMSCWTPYFMCNIIDPIVNHTIPALLYEVLMWVAYLNAVFNPLVYAFFYSWFRDKSKLLLEKLYKLC
ncbi:trace amine-associated receptor 11 [Danio rerio]|uniref:Trace amine-associated receptor 11 n=1 Tax=Danio rerio TaxID=7955 RepID=Q5QNN2_DANRE|nr:trace amine-associated receptor 11 [Danio rerio]XP_021324201.1 trace amine-associated receptor 11 isoform X1 [Danio rerio]AAI63651.1 Trace amine-associated receptor 1a [Danio rerio]AAI63664.1 Trace amine-associated receptor 1a [Danio rerio]|eukprot:NP_001076546.1 trace amine-associated receptor 11 [Danio rerio]